MTPDGISSASEPANVELDSESLHGPGSPEREGRTLTGRVDAGSAGAEGGPDPSKRTFRVAGASSIGGRRAENQDAFLVTTLPQAGPRAPGNARSPRPPSGAGTVLLIVCDGMGPSPRGAVAAHLAVSAIALHLKERQAGPDGSADLGAVLRSAMEQANRLITARAQARPALEGMGATVTAACLEGSALHLAHVGDSRAYILRRGRARQLTRDHTVAQEMLDLGLLSHDEAARSPYRNVLSRSLGADPEVEPALARYEMDPGDSILLCTDGLTGTVAATELAHFVEAEPTPAAACRRLVALAEERGAKDDVTVVIGRMEDGDGTPPSDHRE